MRLVHKYFSFSLSRCLTIKLIASVGGRKFVVTTVRIYDDVHADDDTTHDGHGDIYTFCVYNKRLMSINGQWAASEWLGQLNGHQTNWWDNGKLDSNYS